MTAPLINILDDDFTTDGMHHADISQIIEHGHFHYGELPHGRPERRLYREKLNEIIKEYNHRRGMKIYNLVH